MPGRTHVLGAVLAVFAASAGLPLLGRWSTGAELAPLFAFPPPLAIPTDTPRFSWLVAGLVVVLLGAIAVSWVRAVCSSPRPVACSARCRAVDRRHRLPWWGWAAWPWVGLWWMLAWTRFSWFAVFQPYTFFPLWFGFIAGMSALTVRRTGDCLLRRAPAKWLGLFVASAAFWWLFEWLNRFARNWHYLGTEDFGPWRYSLHATLCFSTVLPAVAAVREWLGTFPRWRAWCAQGPAWSWLGRPATAPWLAVAGLVALLLTGVWPHILYPALWVAPLALATGIGLWARADGWWGVVAQGDWTIAGSWAVAALGCGCFWELWNAFSLPKWIYTVPYVDRWHLFEMPLLGYAGYLPFGLQCQIICAFVLRRDGPDSRG